ELQTISSFFRAEDGIRGLHVTGVQTCGIPVSYLSASCRAKANTSASSSLTFCGSASSVFFHRKSSLSSAASILSASARSLALWKDRKSVVSGNRRDVDGHDRDHITTKSL